MSSQFKDSLTSKLTQRQVAKPALAAEQSSVETIASTNSDAQDKSATQDKAAEVTQEIADVQSAPTSEPLIVEEQSATTAANEALPTSINTPAIQEATEPEIAQNNSGDDSADTALRLLNEQAEFLVAQAHEHIANFRLKTPKSNSALGSLEQLKRIAPQSPKIAEIEKAIGDKYLSLASSKIKQGDKAGAQKHLSSAKSFISDEAVLNEYQANINAVAVKRTKPAPQSQTAKPVEKVDFVCDPVVKVVGVPLLGRTFTASQSLPLSQQEILSKSLPWVRKDYSNVYQSNNSITFEQPAKRKPIKGELQVMRDGNNTKLTITTKVPPGLVVKKSDYKKTFCDLLATF